MARILGLGVKHDIPMSAVSAGLAPDRQWKTEVRGEDWRIGDTVNASIGQGYVLASPLHLAVMVARIASGRNVVPRLVHTIDGVEQPYPGGEALPVNENNLRRVRASMYDVVNSSVAPPMAAGSWPKACGWRARPAHPRCAASPPRNARAA